MTIYVAPEVADVIALHPYLSDPEYRASTIRNQLARQAETVFQAHGRRDPRVRMQLGSWWPGATGLASDALLDATLMLDDARLTLAREHGFEDWGDVETRGDAAPSSAFEDALDAMLAGDADRLDAALDETPTLVTEVSSFGHQATLLHYIGANGVESHRQTVPMNAPELAHLLIAHGAEVNAMATMYGGGQTPFDLASTSAHPRNAGIADALNAALRIDGGNNR
ncbi:MAG: hypothetical protein AAFQ42_15195 [Pseudomonadota bacterium]